MWENDICLCASEDCPKYQDCLRGAGIKRQGIYTISILSEICNEQTNYKCFIKTEKENGRSKN